MFESIYILGAGGHGRVVLDALIAEGISVTGFLDASPQLSRTLTCPVLGGDEYLDHVEITNTFLVNGLGANPQTFRRRHIFEKMQARGFRFKSLQHPSAIVSKAVNIGQGCQIMAGAVMQPGVTLQENVVINTRASIDHDCIIDSHAFIAPGAILCGQVEVAISAFIGAGAVILPNIKIGKNSIIGAGAVVKQSIPDGWIVSGNPAIKIGTND